MAVRGSSLLDLIVGPFGVVIPNQINWLIELPVMTGSGIGVDVDLYLNN